MDNNKNIENKTNNQNTNNLIELGEIKLLFWLSAVIFVTLAIILIKVIGILGQLMSGFGGMIGGAVNGFNSMKLLLFLSVIFGIASIINIVVIFNIRSKALNSNNLEKMNLPNYVNPFRLAISGIIILAISLLSMMELIPEFLAKLVVILGLIALIACIVFSVLTLLKNYPIVFSQNNSGNVDNNTVQNPNPENNQSQLVNSSNTSNNSGNVSQSGFLDNILQKDNENNKLFLKILFWLTTAASVILLYTGIKGLSLYLNAKKAASEASSGSLDNLFSSGADLLGKGMDFFSTAKTMQGILNLIVIAVIVAAVLIYLKAKKENKIEKLKNLNYYFIGGFIIFGLLEMYAVHGLVKALTSLSGMFGAATGSAPNFGLIKFSLALIFITSLGSVITNYFVIFRGKNIEIEDIKSEWNNGAEKINAIDPEKKKKYTAIGIAIVGIIALYYICTNFIFLQNFDFNKYYTVRIDGASGSGKITNYQNPEFPLETANGNTEKPKKEEEFAKEGGITFNFSKTEGIQNGDTIDVEVSYNKDVAKKLKIRPQNSKFKIKVNGLLEYAKNANQVKDLKNYITKLAQRKIELQKDDNPSDNPNLSGIYYKQDENGNLSIKYFIQNTFAGFLGNTESFEPVEIGNIVLDKNNNITSYEEIKSNSFSSEKYNNAGEVQAAMSSQGYTLLN